MYETLHLEDTIDENQQKYQDLHKKGPLKYMKRKMLSLRNQRKV